MRTVFKDLYHETLTKHLFSIWRQSTCLNRIYVITMEKKIRVHVPNMKQEIDILIVHKNIGIIWKFNWNSIIRLPFIAIKKNSVFHEKHLIKIVLNQDRSRNETDPIYILLWGWKFLVIREIFHLIFFCLFFFLQLYVNNKKFELTN